MSLATNRQLVDLSTRLQLYIEGVKNYQATKMNAILFSLQSEISPLLLKTEYRNLDRLSKTQLLKLIVDLRKMQSRVFNKYAETLIKDLRQFMESALITHRGVWAAAYAKEDEGDAFPFLTREEALLIIGSAGGKSIFGVSAITQNPDLLWSKLKGLPMAANGQTLLMTLAGFTVGSQLAIENAVRKAWANKQTNEQLLTQLFDTSNKQGFASELQKIVNSSNATTATLLQHIAAIVDNAVQSALFDRYIWLSIIDSATTNICRSRNNKKYKYGEGPLPPAHFKCRSSTAPDNGGEFDSESFFEWLTRQSDLIRRYVLGKNYAKFEKGELGSEDLPKVSSLAPISIAEFKSREIISNILSSR